MGGGEEEFEAVLRGESMRIKMIKLGIALAL